MLPSPLPNPDDQPLAEPITLEQELGEGASNQGSMQASHAGNDSNQIQGNDNTIQNIYLTLTNDFFNDLLKLKQSTTSSENTSKNKIASKTVGILSLPFMLVLASLIGVGTVIPLTPVSNVWKKETMECNREEDGLIKVIVSNFNEPSDTVGTEASLAAQIKREIENSKIPKFSVCTTSFNFVTKSEISQLIDQLKLGDKPAIVIYGDRTPTKANIYVSVINFRNNQPFYADIDKLIDSPIELDLTSKNSLNIIPMLLAYTLSNIHFAEEKDSEAIEVLEQVEVERISLTDISNENQKILARIYLFLGGLFDSNCSSLNQEQCSSALRAYQQASTLDPNLYDAFLNQASLLKKLGYANEAVEAYESLIKVSPPDRNDLKIEAKTSIAEINLGMQQ